MLTDIDDGDVLMMASQRFIRQQEDSERVQMSYDAVEMAVYGEVTGKSVLRTVADDGETWALVYHKGTL